MIQNKAYGNTKAYYDWYKALCQKLLPEPVYPKMVSEEQQNHEIQLLSETIRYDRFFFVINLHDCRIEQVHGVERWLGYPDKDFTFLKFLQIIPAAQSAAHHFTASELVTSLMRGDREIEFMKDRYITTIALRHSDGRYLLCKRLASVFQYSDKHQLLEYMNEFTLIGEYNEETYRVGLTDEKGSRLPWMDDLRQRTKVTFEKEKLFSFQELRILRKYAYAPDIAVAEIAQSFKVKESTIITHKKRILVKAEDIFRLHFESIRQLSKFLREQGLI